MNTPTNIYFCSPDNHNPQHSGPPTAYPQGNQAQLYRVPPRPQHLTRDTRENTLGSLLQGYGRLPAGPLPAGHDQAYFNPSHNSNNLVYGGSVIITQPTSQNQGQQGQQGQQGAPKAMLNGHNYCYAASAFLILESMEVKEDIANNNWNQTLFSR